MTDNIWDFGDVETSHRFELSDDIIAILKRGCDTNKTRKNHWHWDRRNKLAIPDWLTAQLSPHTEIMFLHLLDKWVVTTTCPEDMELLTDTTLLTIACGQQ